MRDDVAKNEEFFRDGNYTQKGRRRLAAIQKVETNQDKGLSYNIDDKTGTFEVLDVLGRKDVNSGGHGIGSSERSGLLYGTFNKDKRSKREVSSLMSGASKYMINKTDPEVDAEVGDEVETNVIPKVAAKVVTKVIASDPAPNPKVPLTEDQEQAKELGLDFTKGATAKILSQQKALKARGYDPGPLDGIWGVSTQNAWNKSQSAADPEAKAKLEAARLKAEAEAAANPVNPVKGVEDVETNPIVSLVDPGSTVSSNQTLSAEELDKIPDSGRDKLDDIAEANDIQVEINLRNKNGNKPSEDPRFKDRSIAELEMDKYDLTVRGKVTTTDVKGKDLVDVNNETNKSNIASTLFVGIGEGDVKRFNEVDGVINQLFSSQYNDGIIDNKEKIGLLKKEMKNRVNSTKDESSALFTNKTIDDLNNEIVKLNTSAKESIIDQVRESYDSSVSYIKSELAKQDKIISNLRSSDADIEDIENAQKTRYSIKSRIDILEKRYKKFSKSKLGVKDYKEFYGDVVLSKDNSVTWDRTRGKVTDSKTRKAEIKEVAKGKSILSNMLKNSSWLEPGDRRKFSELVANEKLNKGEDGKGFDAQKMADKATEKYILDVSFFDAKGTYKEDDEEVKSFTNYVKGLGVKNMYKELPHLKDKYGAYLKDVHSNPDISPKESYSINTIPKIKAGDTIEEFLKRKDFNKVFKNNTLSRLGGTTDIDRVSGGYKGLTEFLRVNKISTNDFRDAPHKTVWLYSKMSNYNKYDWKNLSEEWDNLHSRNMAKYEKGGVLKFQSGNKLPKFLTTSLDGRSYEDINTTNRKVAADNELARLDARRNQLDALKAADTPYKPQYSFKPQLNLGASNNLNFNDYKKQDGFFTTYKTPEQVKVDNLNSMYNTKAPLKARPKQVPANNITIDNGNMRLPANNNSNKEGIVKEDLGTDTNTNPKTLGEKIMSKLKKTREFYTDSGNTGDDTEGNAPWLSKTGINTPLGEVQYNDIAQYYLAKRARDRKVGDVPLNLKKHIDHGSDNVMAAQDIDSAMLNEADQEIAKISSGYKGSDPLMAMVANQMAGEKKSKAKLGVISERAAFRGKEKQRVFNAINASNRQKSADNVRANETRFGNNQLKFEAELAAVTAKAAREAKFDNVRGKLSSNLQSRANTNASLGKSLVTEAEVLDRQRRNGLAQSRLKTSSTAYLNATQLPADKQDKELIADLKTQRDEDFELARGKTYDRNKAIQDYNRISKGTSKLQLGNSIFKNLFG